MRWGRLGGLGLMSVMLAATAAQALPRIDAAGFASHRAIYDVRLGDGQNSAGFSQAHGRIVVEWQDICSGYTLNQRFVTEFASYEGDAIFADARFSSWEASDGDTFRFSMERFFNNLPPEGTVGSANRTDASINYDAPAETHLTMPEDVIFPTEHAVAIVRAAQDGTAVVKRTVFDGSEDGAIYDSVAFIGGQRDAKGTDRFEDVQGAEKLGAMPYWPVTLSYFEYGDKEASLPAYEVSYHLYENGVSDTLKLNYGEFELIADLAEIEFIEAPQCS